MLDEQASANVEDEQASAKEEQELEPPYKPLEEWQHQVISELLQSEFGERFKQLSDTRAYSYSGYYGQKIYHLYTLEYSDIIIEQTDQGEKYPQRVRIEAEEIEGMIHTFLTWYLEGRQQKKEAADDQLGDLSQHPF